MDATFQKLLSQLAASLTAFVVALGRMNGFATTATWRSRMENQDMNVQNAHVNIACVQHASVQ